MTGVVERVLLLAYNFKDEVHFDSSKSIDNKYKYLTEVYKNKPVVVMSMFIILYVVFTLYKHNTDYFIRSERIKGEWTWKIFFSSNYDA